MNNTFEENDLILALKLLDEYSLRTKTLYREIKSELHKRKTTLLIFILMVFVLYFFYIIILNQHYIQVSSLLLNSVFIGISVILCTLFFYNQINLKKIISQYREDLHINVQQLSKLTRFISQLTEHNRSYTSNLREYELKIRLVEAEEVLALTKSESEKELFR